MNLQLSSIAQAPRSVPPWESIITDLGNPPAERIAHVLGVGRSTVYRWQRAGSGPRIACLALFWLTRWGRSAVHTQATNDAMLAAQLARAMAEERDKLARQVNALDQENRELQCDLATARLAVSRGSAAIADHSRTGMAPEGSSADGSARPDSIAWPVLDAAKPWPVLPPDLSIPPSPAPVPAPAECLDAGHQGSPAAPPQEARSGKSPGPGRSCQPRSSRLQGVAPSSPLVQIDARVTPLWHQMERVKNPLCFVLDGTSPAPAGRGRSAPLGLAAAALDPANAVPGTSTVAGLAAAQSRSQGAQESAMRGSAPAPASSSPGGPGSRSAGISMAGRSRPQEPAPGPSPLARPERPAFLGQAPDPPPGAASTPTATFSAPTTTEDRP